MNQSSAKKSAYDQAVDSLLAQLEAGTIPWRKPWVSAGVPRNLVSQKEYRGINVILLALQSYASPYWLTYKQCEGLGGNIKKGEHGILATGSQGTGFSSRKTVVANELFVPKKFEVLAEHEEDESDEENY